MQYAPLSRQLALTFECVSSDLMPESVVILTFDDAQIYQWETDFDDRADNDARLRGQVSGFDAMHGPPDSGNLAGVSFHLHLVDVSVSFYASTVSCDYRTGRWKSVGESS
ncbi:hypothetical protein [Nocardioides sp. URHA0020]|uniref:hypothetical protein n=1 Tax=Nocardioides sp. URHA0020 TaxID=1380392 RepID=UPI0012DF8ECE|nr:hypothetical protein [Nocardioides sp. URHA0020]